MFSKSNEIETVFNKTEMNNDMSIFIRAWTHVLAHVQVGSSSTKWADDKHIPAGLENRFVPDLPLP